MGQKLVCNCCGQLHCYRTTVGRERSKHCEYFRVKLNNQGHCIVALFPLFALYVAAMGYISPMWANGVVLYHT